MLHEYMVTFLKATSTTVYLGNTRTYDKNIPRNLFGLGGNLEKYGNQI